MQLQSRLLGFTSGGYCTQALRVIATPSTLFALLRTVALGWRHEDISEKAREVQRLGRELYA
ncbi:DNA recombination protein RmuC, partial [Bacteroides fragilis]|nr:DNA recombination protein RmuC [Bacteroides fragilis]